MSSLSGQPINTSYIEISKSALENNIRFIRKLLSSDSKFYSVIKGNAYGHGIKNMVDLLESNQYIDGFCVFSPFEASQIIQTLKENKSIIIMGSMTKTDIMWAIENNIEFFIYDSELIDQVIEVSNKCKLPAKVHIELETGMNRTGLLKKNIANCISKIKSNPQCFILKGICTHLAGAESIINKQRVGQQLEVFEEMIQIFSDNDIEFELKHCCCSAVSLRYTDFHMDLGRIGILQYGLWPSQETYIEYLTSHNIEENPLQKVLSWKSKIMTIKRVYPGEYIGYGNAYQANEEKLIAIIPVGYANGFSRTLSNKAKVIINGSYASVIGIVNMNSICVDITHINDVADDNEVILIGRQGNTEITVASFSDFTDQLNYEVLTRLPSNIPRRIIK